MKPIRIVISSPELKRRALACVEALALDPACEITIKEHKRDISAEQRGLYFKWLGIIADHLGYTKEELHIEYKKRWLKPIFERDDPEYSAMIQNIRDVWKQGMKKVAEDLSNQVIKLTSIRDANTHQMWEYMGNIEKEAPGLAIVLPFPDDLYK